MCLDIKAEEISQNFVLRGQDNENGPLNLHELAQLPASPYLKDKNLPDKRKESLFHMLEIFFRYLSDQNLSPILAELALVADDKPFFRRTHLTPVQTFQSFFARSDAFLDDNQGNILLKTWVKAIKKKAAIDLPTLRTSSMTSDYIVKNEALYSCFSISANFPNFSSVAHGQREAYVDDAPIEWKDSEEWKDSDRFFWSPFGTYKPPLQELRDTYTIAKAKADLEAFIRNIVNQLPSQLSEKLAEARVILVPFPRPSFENDYLSALEDPHIFWERWLGTQMSFRPTPGGCLFVIYKSKHNLDRHLLDQKELQFTLFCQYMLTLSALAEARLNLFKHHRELTLQSLGHFTHAITSELRSITRYFNSALDQCGSGKDPGSRDVIELALMANSLASTLSGFFEYAANVSGGKCSPNNYTIRNIETICCELFKESAKLLDFEKKGLPYIIEWHFVPAHRVNIGAFPALLSLECIREGIENVCLTFSEDIDDEVRYHSMSEAALRSCIRELTKNCSKYGREVIVRSYLGPGEEIPEKEIEKHLDWAIFEQGGVLFLACANNVEQFASIGDNTGRLDAAVRFADRASEDHQKSNGLAQIKLAIASVGQIDLPPNPQVYVPPDQFGQACYNSEGIPVKRGIIIHLVPFALRQEANV